MCIQAQSRKDGYVDKTTRQQADYAGVKAKARGEEVADQIRLVPLNGIGNVNKNRSNVDQLIKKADGNYKVVETKLTEGTSKLSKGQEAVQKHVKFGNKNFEVRSNNEDFGLTKGMTIHVDEYEVVYKYKK